MRLGPIQKLIFDHLVDGPAPIRCGMRAPSFAGYDWEEVEAALNRLIKRGIVVKDGLVLYRLML